MDKNITPIYLNDNVYRNAYLSNSEIDKDLLIHADYIKNTLAHMDDCIECPTRGLLARRICQNNGNERSPKYYRKNLAELKTFPQFKIKKEALNERIHTLYPETARARKLIIESNAVVYNRVIKPTLLKNLYIKIRCLLHI